MDKTILGLSAAVVLIGLSGNSLADRMVFKCKTQHGMVYQKSPCAEGEESLSSWVSPKDSDQPKQSLSLEQGSSGHYFVDSEINGNAVTFVIDTGASLVSLPHSVAAAANLECKSQVTMQTANGITGACTVVIDKLKVGVFLIRDVEAVIVPNLSQALLGMNVLQRFNIIQDNNRMRISER
ncbi:MAG: TIGR02281 family clan AA aspartic protease [Methylovulum sp.]|nr:TIGR02281 family clan AA aspartic protease [Methylovulum sp.]